MRATPIVNLLTKEQGERALGRFVLDDRPTYALLVSGLLRFWSNAQRKNRDTARKVGLAKREEVHLQIHDPIKSLFHSSDFVCGF